MEEDTKIKGLKKTLPISSFDTEKMKSEIEPIYSREKLNFEAIKKNPVLKPLAEMNNSFIDMELIINRALYEYQENKAQLDGMIELNPKYSETIILNKFQNAINHVKKIIHAQDIKKENMKRAINEMIRIVGQEYGVLSEEQPDLIDSTKEDIQKKPEEAKRIPEPPTPQPTEPPKPTSFYSDLLDKGIPLLEKEQN